MKILIGLLLLGAFGAGSFLFANASSKQAVPAVAPAAATSCDARVTCTPQGTCLVTCEGPNGQTCSIEIECDGGGCRVVDCTPAGGCQPGSTGCR